MRVILKSTKLTTGTPNLRGIFLATAVISNYMLSFIRPMIVTGNSCEKNKPPKGPAESFSQLSLQVTNSMQIKVIITATRSRLWQSSFS